MRAAAGLIWTAVAPLAVSFPGPDAIVARVRRGFGRHSSNCWYQYCHSGIHFRPCFRYSATNLMKKQRCAKILFIFYLKYLHFKRELLIFAIGKLHQPLLMTLSIDIQVGASCANLLFFLSPGCVALSVWHSLAVGCGWLNIVDKRLRESGVFCVHDVFSGKSGCLGRLSVNA